MSFVVHVIPLLQAMLAAPPCFPVQYARPGWPVLGEGAASLAVGASRALGWGVKKHVVARGSIAGEADTAYRVDA